MAKDKDTGIDLGGRPPLFESPELLQEMIDEYFTTGMEYRTFIVGSGLNKQSVTVQVPTISGLCYFLGFESRQSFYDYEKKSGFTYTIKKARLKIERCYEEQLQYGNSTGAIFALKNMDWHDKSEFDHTTGGEKINIISDDELISRIDKILNPAKKD
jgi:hypothetical protein